MPGKIFVNYRRDDVPGDARGIRDGLVRTFGKSNVFMDVDNLLAGQRFERCSIRESRSGSPQISMVAFIKYWKVFPTWSQSRKKW